MEYDGYHFTGGKLRDGRDIPAIGETLTHSGEVKICHSGLHFSRTAWDALTYAPGNILHRVKCNDVVAEQGGKAVCRSRTIVATIDAEPLLREFARRCALDVIHLWDAPQIVVDYLTTGDESLRTAARTGARDDARTAARDAAWTAAWTARDAAWDAAWDDARTAARDAAWTAAWTAAWADARTAAWDAAWTAARGDARDQFNAMVGEAFANAGTNE